MRKVAIVGAAETSRHLAPFDDPSWEIWTLNDMCRIAPRIDRLFELHSQAILERDKAVLTHELEWLKANEAIPVFMSEPCDWVPMAVEFPTEALLKEFGGYFTNTVSWLIAFALHEGVDALGLWGVDMAHGTEYAHQRPSCEYFVGLARGRGIPVFVPDESDLLKCAEPYGLEKSSLPISIRNRMIQLGKEHIEFSRREQEAQLNKIKIEGAIEILKYVEAAWTNPSSTAQES